MTRRPAPVLGARPRDDAQRWVDGDGKGRAAPKAEAYSARLTIDVTPALRGRIKVAAFHQGITVADLLRTMLEERFGAGAGPS
ncbi:hypothetical protein [Nitrospirillum pindoramense]|uniref:Plasmid segregation centromere-binding protein ParG n=1 Tax=Nitrospirillum amazonense TaxID=28077 RepID=A0A560GKZ8_9PROT|nr:hypothetical protein [Nitrospirillum amazonense]TWB34652.1 plasmid segregation centromere-binding protein ParG [Nitrospirillum amazonense]